MATQETELLIARVCELLQRAGVPFKVVPQQGRLLIEVIAAGEDPDLFERVGLLTDEVKQVKKKQHDKKVKDK